MKTSQYTNNEYTVGWISPLRDELVVAIEMLDEEHGMPMQTPKEDTNTYYLGKIGDHNIAMACLAGGQMGIGSAAVVGENMRRTFKNIRFALLVGIGGGVPSKEKDVRLGDVVVSYPDGPYPGIVQYDYGKLHADGEIETKGWLNAPPSKLLAAVDMLRVLHSRPKNPINNMCKIIDELGPEFAYPGDKHDSPDHLYPVEYPHITRPGSETCKSCDTTRILHRVNREHPHKPNVHYGIIASGNLVVKDGVGREKIDKRYRNLIWCCEMEAAGLVNNFPCLAIRGITDYCDSHKNDTWRRRAIAAACAYSKELLLHIERTDVEEMESAVNVMKAVQEKVEILFQGNEEVEQTKVLRWLSSDTENEKLQDSLGNWCQGTSAYFLDSPKFSAWVTNDTQTLLCPGIPGAGKTIISSVVAGYLGRLQLDKHSSTEMIGVACLFCEYERRQEQTPQAMVAALLRQLAEQSGRVLESVRRRYHLYESKTKPSLHDTFSLLSDSIPKFQKVYLVVDALDECERAVCLELLSLLHELQKKTGVRIMATSRHFSNLPWLPSEYEVLEVKAHEEDVLKVLDDRIQKVPRWARVSPELRSKVKTELVRAVDGMFVLAIPFLDSIQDEQSHGHMQDALERLSKSPDKISTVYERLIERIACQSQQRKEQAYRVLSWVIYAKRSLTSRELRHALAIRSDWREIKRSYIIDDLEDVVSCCCGLVVINRKRDTVQLMHHTTRRYFENLKHLPTWIRNAEVMIANACLTYLCLDTFEKGPCRSDKTLEARLRKYVFLEYAAQHWGDHCRDASNHSQLEEMALRFLKHDKKLSAANQVVQIPESRDPGYSQSFTRDVTGLQIAASFGLVYILPPLLKKTKVNKTDSDGRTALHRASEGGYEAAVEILLSKRADMHLVDRKRGWTALHFAAWKGHASTVRLLLKRKSNFDLKDRSGQTPLHLAASNGHVDTAQCLLSQDANPSLRDEVAWTALHAASWQGSDALVHLLLQHTSANTRDRDGVRALHCAAGQGHVAVVKLLLQNRARAHATDQDGWTALHWASMKRHDIMNPRVLNLLEEPPALAFLISAAQEELTPTLRSAILDVHSTVKGVFFLEGMEAAATITTSSTTSTTTITTNNTKVGAMSRWSWISGQEANPPSTVHLLRMEDKPLALTRLLLAVQDELTALRCGDVCGHETVIRLLLDEAGASVHTECRAAITMKGRVETQANLTALHLAALSGHAGIVQLLLEKGAVAGGKCRANIGTIQTELTALHLAALYGHTPVVELLLKNGAAVDEKCYSSVDWKDKRGTARFQMELTALHLAAYARQGQVVSQLLRSAAVVDAKFRADAVWDGNKFRGAEAHIEFTALHLAALRGSEPAVAFLQGYGADINSKCCVDVDFKAYANIHIKGEFTALHLAAVSGDRAVVDRLLVSIADVNAKGLVKAQASDRVDAEIQAEFTALHLATFVRDEAIAQRLLGGGADVNAKCHVYVPFNPKKPADGKKIKKELKSVQGELTALHLATMRNDQKMVQCLITCGADINACCSASLEMDSHTQVETNVKLSGHITALHLAAIRKSSPVLRILLEYGAHVDPMCQVNIGLNFQVHDSNKEITGVANIGGQVTPLHIAVMRSDRDATEALLRCGADVNGLCPATISTTGQFDAKINVRGEVKIQGDLSPLHLATLRGAEPVIQQLLRYKPDLGLMCHAQLDLQCAVSTGMSIQADIKVQFKANALHLAILLGREDMVRQYLAAGMKPSSDGEGTLVYLAQVLRRQSIAQLLAQNGG